MSGASDLIDALKRHHAPTPSKPIGGILVTEIEAPASARRADALWLPINRANRGEIHGYETKISRQDVLAELRDTTKADGWERWCARWSLVVPNTSILAGLDIPDRWGILTPPTAANRRTMTVVRPAPRLEPDPGKSGLATAFAKVIYGGDDAASTAAWQEKRYRELSTRWQEQNEEIRGLRAQVGDVRVGHSVTVGEVMLEIERLGGYGPDAVVQGGNYRITAEQIARAVLAASSIQNGEADLAAGFDRLIADAEGLASRVRVTRAAMVDETRFPLPAPRLPRRR